MAEAVTFVLAQRVQLSKHEAAEIRGYTVAENSIAGQRLHDCLLGALRSEQPGAKVICDDQMRQVVRDILDVMETGGRMTDAQRKLHEVARVPITGLER